MQRVLLERNQLNNDEEFIKHSYLYDTEGRLSRVERFLYSEKASKDLITYSFAYEDSFAYEES